MTSSLRQLLILGTLLLASALLPASSAVAADDGSELSFVRLTPSQYRNSIHDIFGQSIQIDGSTSNSGFREHGLLAIGARKLTLSAAEVEAYEALALQISAQVTEPGRRATLLVCKPENEHVPDDDCVASIVSTIGLHLMRRPLIEKEVQSYVAMANKATAVLGDFYSGLQAALVGMLVSPDFLFRIERSVPDSSSADRRQLDGWSRAARLSYFLWDTTPGPALLAAAKNGELMTDEGLDRHVRRMMSSPRLVDGLRAFFSDMLGFDKFATLDIDSSLYPRFTKYVEDDAGEQTLRTIVHHLLDKDADYRGLLDTRETFLTPALAALYGVPIPIRQELGGPVPWVPYEFSEGDPRVGLLSQVSFLSLFSHPGTTSPTLRGKAVREHLMCFAVPPPPPDVDFSIVRDTSNPNYKTVRQRLTAHRTNPTCAGCHTLTDPIGLTLEVFDASGVYRTTENGAPIDTSGYFSGSDYEGIEEFVGILKNDPQVTSCVVNRVFSYGTARLPGSVERAWLNATDAELRESGMTWRRLISRIALHPDFYTVANQTALAGD